MDLEFGEEDEDEGVHHLVVDLNCHFEFYENCYK